MIERWGTYELTLNGPQSGNPFVDVELTAEFRLNDWVFKPHGFYDGDGIYKIRFMPDAVGEWTYTTTSNRAELDGRTGEFTCIESTEGNHGPVRVQNDFYLRYADGTPYHQFGTTCYAWTHQGDAMEEQTLQTLADAPFNKLRMCIFPKDYAYNDNDPVYYPYEGQPLTDWNSRDSTPSSGGILKSVSVTSCVSVSKQILSCFTPMTGGISRTWTRRAMIAIFATRSLG